MGFLIMKRNKRKRKIIDFCTSFRYMMLDEFMKSIDMVQPGWWAKIVSFNIEILIIWLVDFHFWCLVWSSKIQYICASCLGNVRIITLSFTSHIVKFSLIPCRNFFPCHVLPLFMSKRSISINICIFLTNSTNFLKIILPTSWY